MPLIVIYQISYSCFLEDIDPMFQIWGIYKTDIHDFTARAFSNIFKVFDARYFEIWNNI